MAPFKSTLARSVGKLLGVFSERDLSLRGATFSSRYVVPPFTATGGTKITSGSNVYHVFISNQNFVVASGTNNIELLVVGGGGGTSGTYQGGGGGGGIAYGPSVLVSSGTYAVVVGDGGATIETPAQGNASTPGNNSSIVLPAGTITGLGGGTGTIDAFQNSATTYIPGGSGGGNGDDNDGQAGDATQPGQPNFGVGILHYGNPGHGPPSGNAPGGSADGGGGGGAGAGGGPSHSDSRNGGNGQSFTNFPGPVLAPALPTPDQSRFTTAVGPTGLFGGGGTGARGPTAGVPGGGGGGETPGTGGDGRNYTGGGGGGVVGGIGGTGGKGIVIVKYSS
jgi:hypothetical protein